jgi:large subunit ribosomal protein L10
MPTEKKIAMVQELRRRIERAAIIIAAEYRGLTVTQLAELRHAIRDAGVEMKVVKNRLFKRAAQEAERPELADLLEGPTAVIFGYEDVAASAKVVTEYIRQARNAFAVRRGMMDRQPLSAADVLSLATLPPRPILAGQIAGALQWPVARLAGLLHSLVTNAPGRLLNDSLWTFGGLLEARAKQLERA